jgi:hypothetical protein
MIEVTGEEVSGLETDNDGEERERGQSRRCMNNS